MITAKVGVKEFRAHLSNYLIKSDKPTVITRNGDTIGYYIPARQKTSQRDLDALKRASLEIQKMLVSHGITEDEISQDFKRWRASKPSRL